MRSFAKRLRDLRAERGESLATAAAAIGCTKAHLWDLEKGKSKNPTILLLKAIAKHYQTTVSYLIGETALRSRMK